jgi:hypothetical protein
MQNNENVATSTLRRAAWNKDKLVGAKPPLRPRHVWSIRTKLQISERDSIWPSTASCAVAMSSLSKLDIAPHGYAIERATVRQKKTGAAGAVRGHRTNPSCGR